MKKTFIFIMVPWLMVLFLLSSLLWAQQAKGTASAKEGKGQVPADSSSYIIGPEDVLTVHIWKEEALSRTVPVRMDGMISLPLVDDIKAEGLTPLQLKAVITEKLSAFISEPVVTVIVLEMNSYKVYVSGQVRAPGVYRLRSETNLVQLISMAGGLTEWADPKGIFIVRKKDGKEERINVNYKKAMKGEIPLNQLLLKPGDIVIVP
jgi:polysaccharide export outer membrane protein